MSTKPFSPDGSDENLESLAEDLLGVHLSSSRPEIEPFEVEAFDLEDAEEEVASPAAPDRPAPSEASEAAGKSPSRRSSQFDDFDDDFGSALFEPDEDPLEDDAEAIAVPVTVTVTVTVNQSDADVVDELAADIDEEEDEEEAAEADDDELAEPATSGDTFWDALDGWDWDDESEAAPSAAGRPRREAPSSPPAERPVEASARKTRELRDDGDFGAGLEDEAQPAATGDAEERRSRRPCRRRRRGSDRDKQRGETSSAPEVQDRGEQRTAESAAVERPPADDGFGAGLEVEEQREQSSESRPRSGRRRRRRRSGAQEPRTAGASAALDRAAPADNHTESDTPTSDAEAIDEADAEVGDEADAEAGDENSPDARRYRNVPTWEEAIRHLVRPAPRRTGTDSSSGEGQRRGGRGKSGPRRGGGGGRRGGRRSSSS